MGTNAVARCCPSRQLDGDQGAGDKTAWAVHGGRATLQPYRCCNGHPDLDCLLSVCIQGKALCAAVFIFYVDGENGHAASSLVVQTSRQIRQWALKISFIIITNLDHTKWQIWAWERSDDLIYCRNLVNMQAVGAGEENCILATVGDLTL